MKGLRGWLICGVWLTSSLGLYGVNVPEGGVFKWHSFLQDTVVADGNNPTGILPFQPYGIEFFISDSVQGTTSYDGVRVSWSGTSSPQQLSYDSNYQDYSINYSLSSPPPLTNFPNGAYDFRLTLGGSPITTDPMDNVTLTLDSAAASPPDIDGTFPELLATNNVPRLKFINGNTPIFFDGGAHPDHILINPFVDNTFTWNAPIFSGNNNAVGFFVDEYQVMNGELFDNAFAQNTSSFSITTAMNVFQPGEVLEMGILFVNVVEEKSLGVSPNDIIMQSGFITETIFYAQVVPEPSTYALMILGGGVLLWFFRSKR